MRRAACYRTGLALVADETCMTTPGNGGTLGFAVVGRRLHVEELLSPYKGSLGPRQRRDRKSARSLSGPMVITGSSSGPTWSALVISASSATTYGVAGAGVPPLPHEVEVVVLEKDGLHWVVVHPASEDSAAQPALPRHAVDDHRSAGRLGPRDLEDVGTKVDLLALYPPPAGHAGMNAVINCCARSRGRARTANC